MKNTKTATIEKLQDDLHFVSVELLSKENDYNALLEKHKKLEEEHKNMLREYNKMMGEYKEALEKLVDRSSEVIELRKKNVKTAVKPTKKPTLRLVG
ncbi:hypothetical protein R7U00_000939 [Salmonella enterica]|nr:hypothetical protein [Salmonella enterica]EFR5502825.1 hypothetical protein [Salmonella enterica]EIE8425814.1 hypothetical protein [Salmonella enterica]EJH3161334.1 hypothetical protein [Salmonella enterica]EJW4993877.1 hypothetical protein [Salmonella enterica]